MKSMKRAVIVLVFVVVAGLVFTGCNSKQQQSSSGAKQVNDSKILLNSEGRTVEQQNIFDRQKATMDPTKVMWIHLIALNGKIVQRMAVRNKVTSSGKRLEPIMSSASGSGPNSPFKIPDTSDTYFTTNEFTQADGCFGSSDPYIFWFDPQGRYHQWGTAGGLGYLLTDYPIDIANPMDEVTCMYNMNKAAHDWQMQQEAELRKKEGK